MRLVIMKKAAIALALAATTAHAQGRQDHERFEFGPAPAETYDAGVVCDFAYQIQELGSSIVRIRFYDADGNRIRAMLIGEATVRHTNLDTGMVLEETFHYAIHRNFLTGEETSTGNFWHARDDEGKLVLVGAGRYVVDMATFELIETTPNAGFYFEETICPALEPATAGT